MPTLVNQTEDTSAIMDGETADTAGCLWLSEHLNDASNAVSGNNGRRAALLGVETQMLLRGRPHTSPNSLERGGPRMQSHPPQPNDPDDSDSDRTLSFSTNPPLRRIDPMKNGVDNNASDCSLSRTYDEDDLVLRQYCCSQKENVLKDLSNHSIGLSFSNYVERINDRPQRLSLSPCTKSTSHDPTICAHCLRDPPDSRKMGPNESIYMQQYHPYISSAIVAFRDKYPGRIPLYSSLETQEKLREQQFVMDLLSRVRISNDKNDALSANKDLSNVSTTRDVRENESLVESSVDLLSPLPDRRPIDFSPIPTAADVGTSVERLSPLPQEMDDSTQSIEIARSAVPFDSPNLLRLEKKRFASTSGKRGADTARIRRDYEDDKSLLFSASPSKFLVNSIGRLSLKGDNDSIFSASQSPIVATSPYSPMQHDQRSSMDSIASDISFGDDVEDQAICVRPLCDHDSIVETTMLPDKRVHWDFDGKLMKEAPTAVRLVEGETMRWHKLPTEYRQKTALPTQTFSDPFLVYPESLRRRLDRMYSWILRRDQNDSTLVKDRCAAVLSLTNQNITDLIVKLHLEYPCSEDHPRVSTNPLYGSTLIVTRTKEELELWKRSFREGSALSVLNHTSMPLAQRKSQSCAEKVVHFDVVLTTYDALKSPDVAIKLDPSGFAITAATKDADGWFTSSSSASQTAEQIEQRCKPLSALHRVHWSRLILVDILGRKGFLSKLDTARVKAVRAMNADSRLAFFAMSDDDSMSGIQALVKSDRTALVSLSSVLRVDRDEADMTSLLDDVVIDFRGKSTSTTTMNK